MRSSAKSRSRLASRSASIRGQDLCLSLPSHSTASTNRECPCTARARAGLPTERTTDFTAASATDWRLERAAAFRRRRCRRGRASRRRPLAGSVSRSARAIGARRLGRCPARSPPSRCAAPASRRPNSRSSGVSYFPAPGSPAISAARSGVEIGPSRDDGGRTSVRSTMSARRRRRASRPAPRRRRAR